MNIKDKLLIKEKKNALRIHLNESDENNIEYDSGFLFYYHCDDDNVKYMIYTQSELMNFLFENIKQTYVYEQFTFDALEKITDKTINQLEHLFLSNVMLYDKRISCSNDYLDDGTIKKTYSVCGTLAIEIKGEMSLDEFLEKYIEYVMQEKRRIQEFTFWSVAIVEGFYIFNFIKNG